MVGQSAEVGSLEEYVKSRVAEFRATGIDAPMKVSLIELAWARPERGRTVLEYTDALGNIASPETVQAHLDDLEAHGFLVRQDDGAFDAARYALSACPKAHTHLSHLLELWSDPTFRVRAVARLRYGA